MPQPGRSFYEAARAFLIALGAPLTKGNVNVVVAWMWCEKPHPDGAWQWNNPLNTTLACCNWVRNVNQVGVKEYPTREDGINALVLTISRRYYPTLRRALLAGDPDLFLSATGEIRTWGTNPDCISITYNSLPPPPDWAIEPPAPPQPPCPPGYIWDPNASKCVPTAPPPIPPPSVPALPVAVALGAVLLGGAGAGVLIFAHREKVKQWWQKVLPISLLLPP